MYLWVFCWSFFCVDLKIIRMFQIRIEGRCILYTHGSHNVESIDCCNAVQFSVSRVRWHFQHFYHENNYAYSVFSECKIEERSSTFF